MIRALAIAALLAALAWAGSTDTRAGLVMAPTGGAAPAAEQCALIGWLPGPSGAQLFPYNLMAPLPTKC
jgi:hypothetical protein